MKAAVVFVILLMLAGPVLIEINGHATNDGLPLVQAAERCPRLSNPCDRVNCNRPNTKAIA